MPDTRTPDQTALLTAVLNCLIPARDVLPGAGDLGVAAMIDAALSAAPPARHAFAAGLRAIELAAAQPFAALDGAHQEAALLAVEQSHPSFFATLVEHAYRHYYTHPRVQQAVGLTDAPPQPRGHHLPAFDDQLLAIQRKREPFWRRVP